ncbi:ArsO family NAD(P)H-dependent flavin-containing monooxygenase [Nakamurella deserti]|uniref:ArsO family NAD(P)H-dependent flavin-containing monooxygenase n=1 Tax=Nakamurella deserti TaxID=2164074 RepID=UPI000DBE02B5|nr:ArsO family NAD(P)H-dependent flavin-containing monooxygenase [Nakamurella deserti]
MTARTRVAVIGAGQAGLAAAFHLRRAGFEPGRDYMVLDRNPGPGGAWQHMWHSLRLFSPAEHSSLPGRRMPPSRDGFPTAGHVRDYLADYEQHYGLPVRHGVTVDAVRAAGRTGPLEVHTDRGMLLADTVLSATGSWDRPFRPHYPGMRDFRGRQLHARDYRDPAEFAGHSVVVVGGGNSAAQILAEVSTVARTTWVTRRPPRFMPDDVDGRVLFQVATRRIAARAAGTADSAGPLGDIVMVPSVLDARDRGALVAHPPLLRIVPDGVVGADGGVVVADTIIWCTGFRPALHHLAPLRPARDGDHPAVDGTRLVSDPRLHLLGHGDWTGPASATLIGVGRTARDAVARLVAAPTSA